MPNRKKCYTDMVKFRETTNAQQKRYYSKTAIYAPREWDPEHDKMVLEHSISDSELSRIIGHSVKAIQVRRHKLKKRLKEAEGEV